MSTEFLGRNIWPQLTKAVRASRQPSQVAVAYFSQGASKMLPLCEGSRLVVDASERSVASGLTCPKDLMNLVKAGVSVYTVPNLHAKVFVVGGKAYVGSANVSTHSAEQLIEAVLITSEPTAVSAARDFVSELCLHELTPANLEKLDALYRPPSIPGGKPSGKVAVVSSKRPSLPRLFLTKLRLQTWSDQDNALQEAARPIARKRQKHPDTFVLECFRYAGKCPFEPGDVVIQVTLQHDGRTLVSSPGEVVYLKTRESTREIPGKERGKVSFVYLERPAKRRREASALARSLRCPVDKLRGGLVRNADFAEALLRVWNTDK